jgi:subtilisin-like proprotein convertase family protein
VFDDQAASSIEDVGANEEIDGGYRPEEALAALKRKSPTGNWRLLTEDQSGPGDGGSVGCFEVTVKYKKAQEEEELTGLLPGTTRASSSATVRAVGCRLRERGGGQ